MMTRSRTLAAAATDAVTSPNSNSMDIANKQIQNHRPLRRRKSPFTLPPASGHRSRSQLVKKILTNNDNAIRTSLFFRSNSTTDTRSLSSTTSSRSSSTTTSRSSSTSSTISSISSNSSSSSPTSLVTANLNKLKINSNNDSSSSSTSTTMLPTIQQIDRLPQPGLIEFYRSSRQGMFLCLHGYTYEYVSTTKCQEIKWRCKEIRHEAKCASKIYTSTNVGTDLTPVYKYIRSNKIYHSHDPDLDTQKVALFNCQLKSAAESNQFAPPSKLINQLTTKMKLDNKQIAMIPKFQTLRRKVHRIRSKNMPGIPRSMKFDIPDTFSTTSSNEKFVIFDHTYAKETKRIIAFASPLQLQKLFSSPLICLDGTFSIVPNIYKQLLIIQSIDVQNYDATPVLYSLLNDKKAYTYGLLFRALKKIAKKMNMNFSPVRIITDFENSIITTVKKQVRHENIPLLQSDWFLDRIIIERIRDSTKFTFECNCWFRKEQPDINISALSDLQSNDKNNSWKTNLTIVIILIISVALITCIMCCTDKYCQHRGFSSVHTQQESSILDRYHLQLPEPSAPPFVDNTITPWKDIRNTLPSDNDASVVIVRPTTVNSTDEPPAYTDLFPN